MADPELRAADRTWLHMAIDLSARCDPSPTAFSVGAVVVGANDQLLATGYSRETDPTVHAEEAALSKLAAGDSWLPNATMYSSMEPCGRRRSRPRTCAQLIIDAGIRRVVYALTEPPVFVAATGAQVLRAAGVHVIEITDLAPEAHKINRHLLT